MTSQKSHLEGNILLSPHDQAQARSYSYHLLGTVFLQGVHDGNISQLRALPTLASQLKAFPSDESIAAGLGPEAQEVFDHAAADHQHWFGFNLFPFQSIFLSEDCRVGGDQTHAVLEAYQKSSFPIATKGDSPDHIGVMLYFLGFLSQREAQGWDQNNPPAVQAAQAASLEFLDTHLLEWLPPFVVALRQTQHPFYSLLGDVLWALVLEHREQLGSESSQKVGVALGQGDGSSFLEHEKTSLRDIAAYCLTPFKSGWYITRDTIRTFSREQEAPAGFGGRQLMLHNLFRSAVEYEGLPAVLTSMQRYTNEWVGAYQSLDDQGLSIVKDAVKRWVSRVESTHALLGTMKEKVFHLQDEPLPE